MKETLSRPEAPDRTQPDGTDHDFERTYRKHEGAELVRLVLSVTDRIVRMVHSEGAAPYWPSSPAHAGTFAPPQEREARARSLPAVRSSALDKGIDGPDTGVVSAPKSSKATAIPRARISAIVLAGLLLAPLLVMGEATGEEAKQTMAGETDIPILLEVFSCASDLLHCRDINTQGMAFAKMSSCDDELTAVQARAQKSAARGTVIFARCRYSPAPARKAPPLAAILRMHPMANMPENAVAAHPQ